MNSSKLFLNVLFLFSGLLATTPSSAINIDSEYLRQLNNSAIESEALLSQCAQELKLSVAEAYSRLDLCESRDLKQKVFNLKTNIRMFALSSFEQARTEQTRLIASPLLLQLILEEMSKLSLEKFEVHGGNSGFGICTGIINIGICKTETQTKTAMKISEAGQRFLRLLDSFASDNCEFGYFPNLAAKMMAEIANAQAEFDALGYGSYKAKNGQTFIGNAEMIRAIMAADGQPQRAENLEAYQIARAKYQDFAMNCNVHPARESGIEFFQKLKSRHRVD